MAILNDEYYNGKLWKRWDVDAKMYREYALDGSGTITLERSFNDDENAAAASDATEDAAEATKKTLEDKIQASYDTINTQLGATTDPAGYTTVRAMQNLLATKANTDALTVKDGKNILGWLEKVMVNLKRNDRRILEQYDTAGE